MNISPQKSQNIKVQRKNMLSRLLSVFLTSEKTKAALANEADEARELLESIRSAKKDWICANMNFEFAESTEMIDYYIYKIKACEVNYEHLIRRAKEVGIKVDLLEPSDTFYNNSIHN